VNCYPFIEAERACRRDVKRACELLKVSRAAFLLSSVLQELCNERAPLHEEYVASLLEAAACGTAVVTAPAVERLALVRTRSAVLVMVWQNSPLTAAVRQAWVPRRQTHSMFRSR
jgi:hypothetical protein